MNALFGPDTVSWTRHPQLAGLVRQLQDRMLSVGDLKDTGRLELISKVREEDREFLPEMQTSDFKLVVVADRDSKVWWPFGPRCRDLQELEVFIRGMLSGIDTMMHAMGISNHEEKAQIEMARDAVAALNSCLIPEKVGA